MEGIKKKIMMQIQMVVIEEIVGEDGIGVNVVRGIK